MAAATAAALSMLLTSRPLRKLHAASTCSGVSRLMTPIVKWMAPTGRIALMGKVGSSLLESLLSLGVVTSVAKRWREDCNCGREVDVARGRRRKWVSFGFLGAGAMVDLRVMEGCRIDFLAMWKELLE